MIEYYSETDFRLIDEQQYTDWILKVLKEEGKALGAISYVFCSDDYLLELNSKFLNHDTLTDIITFPLEVEGDIQAEIYISIPRVKENARERGIAFEEELKRVMIHGVLHLCGYADATDEEIVEMRRTEDKYIKLFHVEQQGDV